MSLRESQEWQAFATAADIRCEWSMLFSDLEAQAKRMSARRRFSETRQFVLLGVIFGYGPTQIARAHQKAEKRAKGITVSAVNNALDAITDLLENLANDVIGKLQKTSGDFSKTDWIRYVLEHTDYRKKENTTYSPPRRDLVSDFIGREAEVQDLTTQILSGGTKLIHLHGSLGNGKSYIAIKVAQDLEREHGFKSIRINLENGISFSRVCNEILSYFGRNHAEAKTTGDKLKEVICLLQKEDKICLIFDNIDSTFNATGELFDIKERSLYHEFFQTISLFPTKGILITTSRAINVFRNLEAHIRRQIILPFSLEESCTFLSSLGAKDTDLFKDFHNRYNGNPRHMRLAIDIKLEPEYGMSLKNFFDKYVSYTVGRVIDDSVEIFCQELSEDETKILIFIASSENLVSIESIMKACGVSKYCVDALARKAENSLLTKITRGHNSFVGYSSLFYRELIKKYLIS